MGSTARRNMCQHALLGRRVRMNGQRWLVTGAQRAPGRGAGFAFRICGFTCANAGQERWTGWRPEITAIEPDGPPLLLRQLQDLVTLMQRCGPDVGEANRATDDEWDTALATAEAVLATHRRLTTCEL